MLGGAVLRHATINLTDNSQIQSLTFNNRVMKLTSAAAFCFITLLAQIFSVSLAVGSSARKKKWDAFPNSAPALWVLRSFSGLLTATIINFSYLKCECVDGAVTFQHRWLSYAANLPISHPDSARLGWSLTWESHVLFKTKPKSEKPSISQWKKSLIQATQWPKRTACMV